MDLSSMVYRLSSIVCKYNARLLRVQMVCWRSFTVSREPGSRETVLDLDAFGIY